MTKADIVDIISKGTGMTKVETAAVVDGFLATVSYALQQGDRVELRGFGSFCLRERKEKHVPNPRTGSMMHIPHRIVPDFKPSPQLKAYVLKSMEERGLLDTGQPARPEGSEENQTDIFSDIDRFFIDND
ncbi:HU family DNA-binding protein [bacterium]|nr:HU family DNA-binding protein [bacterium]